MPQLNLNKTEYQLYVACGSDYRIRRYLTSSKIQTFCFVLMFMAAGYILHYNMLFKGLLLLYGILNWLELRGFYRVCSRYRYMDAKITDLLPDPAPDENTDLLSSASKLAADMNENAFYAKAGRLTAGYLIVVAIMFVLEGLAAQVILIFAFLFFILSALVIKLKYAEFVINWKKIIREKGTVLVKHNIEINLE